MSMTEPEALLYAQSIQGDGPYNAKIKRVGRKYQIGRYQSKCSWILGEGASWEEAFRAYWIDILQYRHAIYSNNPVNARGFLSEGKYQAQNIMIQKALDENKLPVVQ